jgi:hypothetical protein
MVMSEEILRRRIDRHNALETLKALVLFPGAAVLWFLSFWVFRALCSGRNSKTARNWCGFRPAANRPTSNNPAWMHVCRFFK